jgi:hypothetical protein
MTKDTSRPEKILSLVKELKQLVILDNNDGRNVDQIYKEVVHIQEEYQSWLDDINRWNAHQPLVKPIQTEKNVIGKKHKNIELVTA